MSRIVRLSDAAWNDVAELLDFLVPRAGEVAARSYVDRLIGYLRRFLDFSGARDPT